MKKTLFITLLIGIVLGVYIHGIGTQYACPKDSNIDSSKITPVTDRMYAGSAIQIISGAKESIYIAAFQMKYYENFLDSKQNKIVRELIYAKERGVDVVIVVDEFSKKDNAYDLLTAKGVKIKYDGKDVTTHSKLIVVDGKYVLIGSSNFSFYGLEKNREANVLVEDSRLAKYFIEYIQDIFNS